jgi:glucose-6-phosphate 1-dehydrogenase
VSLDADAVRDEKVKVLRGLRPPRPEQVAASTVRGQYGAGAASGKPVPGYLEEKGVASESRTETYVAHRLLIDNWRWAGVPFYLRAGKRLPKRVTEVALRFRDVPHRLFRAGPDDRIVPNTLVLRIQPQEGISLKFDAKVPGPRPQIEPVSMEFHYGTSWGMDPPEAYERLLLDAILGDSTLFIRADEVESSWTYVDLIRESWAQDPSGKPETYAAGTWGPTGAGALLERDGRAWRRL